MLCCAVLCCILQFCAVFTVRFPNKGVDTDSVSLRAMRPVPEALVLVVEASLKKVAVLHTHIDICSACNGTDEMKFNQ